MGTYEQIRTAGTVDNHHIGSLHGHIGHLTQACDAPPNNRTSSLDGPERELHAETCLLIQRPRVVRGHVKLRPNLTLAQRESSVNARPLFSASMASRAHLDPTRAPCQDSRSSAV